MKNLRAEKNRNIAYISGRMIAIIDNYAHKKFGPNTLSNGFNHPAQIFDVFKRYIDTTDEFYNELQGINLPITTKNGIDKSRMLAGYYHQKAAYDDMLSKKDIRQRIQAKLSYFGITQKGLAEAVGVAPQTICDYLAGRRNLPYEILEKTFDFLGL